MPFRPTYNHFGFRRKNWLALGLALIPLFLRAVVLGTVTNPGAWLSRVTPCSHHGPNGQCPLKAVKRVNVTGQGGAWLVPLCDMHAREATGQVIIEDVPKK